MPHFLAAMMTHRRRLPGAATVYLSVPDISGLLAAGLVRAAR